MKTLLLVVCLMLSPGLSSPLYAQAPSFASSTAEGAAWNVSGFTPIPSTKVRKQAKALALLDAEVVGLVEINPDSAVDDIIQHLSQAGLCYTKSTRNQTVLQDIAVIAKCGITMTNPRLVPGSDDGNPRLRKALAVDVQIGQFDFLLIVVHLKADRGTTAHRTRDRQAKAIATFIRNETQSAAQKDVLLLGDYNMIPGQDISNFHELSPTGFLDFISSHDLREQKFSVQLNQ